MIARYFYIAILACMFIVLACEIPENPVYGPDNPDPNPPGTPAAVLTAVTPNTGYLLEVVTITGSGFNPNPADNFVQFGTGVGTVLTASATELTVELPALGGVTVNCRVAPTGAVEFSNELPFTFNNAIEDIALGQAWPMGVEADDAGNVYFGSADDEVLYKVDMDGNQTVYADVAIHGALRWGPGGDLYGADHWDGYIYRISDNGATVETYLEIGSAIDFDWAENGNMYIVTNGANLWMYDGATATLLDEGDGEYKSCRIFGDHLYVCNRGDDKLHKWSITSDGVGAMEIISEDNNPKGLEVTADGTLIVTSSRDYSLYLYDLNGVSLGALFDGALADDDESNAMRYIRMHGKFVYACYPGGTIRQIYVGMEAAPNNGLALP